MPRHTCTAHAPLLLSRRSCAVGDTFVGTALHHLLYQDALVCKAEWNIFPPDLLCGALRSRSPHYLYTYVRSTTITASRVGLEIGNTAWCVRVLVWTTSSHFAPCFVHTIVCAVVEVDMPRMFPKNSCPKIGVSRVLLHSL